MIDLKTGKIYSDDGTLLVFKDMKIKDLDKLIEHYPHHKGYTSRFIVLNDVKFMNLYCNICYLIINDKVLDVRLNLPHPLDKEVKSLRDVSEKMLEEIHHLDCQVVKEITGNSFGTTYNWGFIKPILDTRSWGSYILIQHNK